MRGVLDPWLGPPQRKLKEGMNALLRPGLTWDFDAALRVVLEEIVVLLPGDPWSGTGG